MVFRIWAKRNPVQLPAKDSPLDYRAAIYENAVGDNDKLTDEQDKGIY
jgi:hypothetical protein